MDIRWAFRCVHLAEVSARTTVRVNPRIGHAFSGYGIQYLVGGPGQARVLPRTMTYLSLHCRQLKAAHLLRALEITDLNVNTLIHHSVEPRDGHAARWPPPMSIAVAVGPRGVHHVVINDFCTSLLRLDDLRLIWCGTSASAPCVSRE